LAVSSDIISLVVVLANGTRPFFHACHLYHQSPCQVICGNSKRKKEGEEEDDEEDFVV